MSTLLDNENLQHQILLSVCSGLGKFEEIKNVGCLSEKDRATRASPYLTQFYTLGSETMECLKDLRRLLKMDHDNSDRHIHKKLGQWNIVKNHLVPIFLQYAAGHEIEMMIPGQQPNPAPSECPFTDVIALDSAENMPPLSEDRVTYTEGELYPCSHPENNLGPGNLETKLSTGKEQDDQGENERKIVYVMSGRNKSLSKLVLEILVALTWPYETQTIEDGKDALNDKTPLLNASYHFLQTAPYYQLEYLNVYKKELASVNFLTVFMEILMHALTQSRRKRENHEYAETIIQLSLLLLRNCLVIPDLSEAELFGTDLAHPDKLIMNRISDEFILNLGKVHVFELCLAICMEMTPGGRYSEWSLIIMELFVVLYFGRDSKDFMPSNPQNISTNRPSEISQELSTLLKNDRLTNTSGNRSFRRHAKFGGVFDMTLSTGQNVIVNDSSVLSCKSEIDIDARKKSKYWKKPNPNDLDWRQKCYDSRLVHCLGTVAKSALESGGADRLLGSVFCELQNNKNSANKANVEEQDHLRFLWLADFFFRSAIDTGDVCQLGKLLTRDIVRYLLSRISTYFSDKLWLGLHSSISCLAAVMLVIERLTKSSDIKHRALADHLQSNIYYDGERLQMLVYLTRNYSSSVSSLGYLRVLIELNHMLLRLMEAYAASKDGAVATIKKKKKSPKASPDFDDDNMESIIAPEQSVEAAESRLAFSKFESLFMCEHVVESYVYFLNSTRNLYESSGVDSAASVMLAHHRIVSLFHRIVVKGEYPFLFYRSSILVSFQEILQSSHKQLLSNPVEKIRLETRDFIRFLLSRFFRTLHVYPLLAIDVFFGKSSRDCRRIINALSPSLPENNVMDSVVSGTPDKELSQNATINPDSVNLGVDKGFRFYQINSYDNMNWKDRVDLILKTICRFKRQSRLHWLVILLTKIVRERENNLALGIDWDEGNSNEQADCVLCESSFPEQKNAFSDPLFCQLLDDLFRSLDRNDPPIEVQPQASSNEKVWIVGRILSTEILRSYLTILNPYIEDGAVVEPHKDADADYLSDSGFDDHSEAKAESDIENLSGQATHKHRREKVGMLTFQQKIVPTKYQARKLARKAEGLPDPPKKRTTTKTLVKKEFTDEKSASKLPKKRLVSNLKNSLKKLYDLKENHPISHPSENDSALANSLDTAAWRMKRPRAMIVDDDDVVSGDRMEPIRQSNNTEILFASATVNQSLDYGSSDMSDEEHQIETSHESAESSSSNSDVDETASVDSLSKKSPGPQTLVDNLFYMDD